ncbi:MAG: 3-methyl-2-oxobutanoate dehydrogenase subunit VorB [Cephaloticoccus sp.]|nr:3-methyl-2-oxobutanoate dehydrogenase subunit VorB [Cephaloticoccus sp.]MCF7760081.1 3-methyl-2-oxobutanoate dehydrogenase subunit VorB [Cephaloticoccus sp.]
MSAPIRPKPFLDAQYCKGCLRCIEACPRDCITPGTEINPATGLVPVEMNLENCNGCTLCMQACPEPYGIRLETDRTDPDSDFVLEDPAKLFGERCVPINSEGDLPEDSIALPLCETMVLKGTYASAIGALLAGCRHVYGYPITPSTEGAELMAKILPKLNGAFVQAVSEVAAVNMMYGTGGAGLPVMTFTSSPGFSLMLEGISYMIGAEVPGVFVNIMRGGPGLGNIAPEQADIKMACRGLGHGNTKAIVLAPSTPQEMLDLTREAFALSFRYRNPVIVLGDGYLGQMTGTVRLPATMSRPGLPAWAVWGDRKHRHNLISSIALAEADLETHNEHLNRKYAAIATCEQRVECYRCTDAEVLVIACNTPARMAKGAVEAARTEGVKAGLFRPITLWPFPISSLLDVLPGVQRIVVVEAGPGQLEDELRLALSHAGIMPPPIESVRRCGGVLPSQAEISANLMSVEEVLL